MAAKKAKEGEINKSEFSRQLLEKNANATASDAVSAWVDAEHPSDEATLKKLKQSFNNFKTLWNKKQAGGGATAKKKPGRKPGVKVAKPVATSTNGSVGGYDEIESHLDRAIVAALNLNDDGLAASLRVARREVIKKSL